MTHGRTALRKAIVTRLDAATGDVVTTDEIRRIMPLPSVQVLTLAEVPTQDSLNGPLARVTSVGVVVRAKGEDVQDVLDGLAETIEAAMSAIIETPSGPRAGARYAGSELELDAQQDDRIGELTLTFDLEWSDP